MKFKLGKNNEWVIYGEDETTAFRIGIHFPNKPTNKKIKELQKLLNLALSDFQL